MKHSLIIAIIVLFSPGLLAQFITKNLSISVIERRVNGSLFTHRVDTIDGKRKDIWDINGQSVEKQEYKEEIAKAAQQELLKELEKEEQKINKQQRFQLQSQIMIIKKLLQNIIQEIKNELVKLNDTNLTSFFLFKDGTISSEEQLTEVKQEIFDTERLLDAEDEDFIEIQNKYQILEKYPEKLQQFYYDSIQHAIKNCDNTRLLKYFLELIS